jgi:hypothetical protein
VDRDLRFALARIPRFQNPNPRNRETSNEG